MPTLAPVPDHVPRERVVDFDYLDSTADPDVYRFFRRLHDGPDLFWTPRQHGHWVATRYADMEAILASRSDFCSEAHTVPKEGKPFPVPLVEYDGPRHTEFRQLLAPAFSPRRVTELEAQARALTIELVEGFHARGQCDFTRDFALKMPIGIMVGLMGLPPADTPFLLELADGIVRGDPDTRKETFAKVFGYIGTSVVPPRRAQPADDLFSHLLAGRADGGRALTDTELMGMGALLVAAGLDTVANMLCFFAHFLAEHPDHRRQLIEDPSLVDGAVDELLRRFHVANVARMVVRDHTFGGVTLKAGELVLIPTPLAGIDDRQFPDATTVDFRRANRRSLVFGRGPHVCIGAFLGRAELRVFLQEWLARIPDFRVAPGAPVRSVSGRVVSIPTLPLCW